MSAVVLKSLEHYQLSSLLLEGEPFLRALRTQKEVALLLSSSKEIFWFHLIWAYLNTQSKRTACQMEISHPEVAFRERLETFLKKRQPHLEYHCEEGTKNLVILKSPVVRKLYLKLFSSPPVHMPSTPLLLDRSWKQEFQNSLRYHCIAEKEKEKRLKEWWTEYGQKRKDNVLVLVREKNLAFYRQLVAKASRLFLRSWESQEPLPPLIQQVWIVDTPFPDPTLLQNLLPFSGKTLRVWISENSETFLKQHEPAAHQIRPPEPPRRKTLQISSTNVNKSWKQLLTRSLSFLTWSP